MEYPRAGSNFLTFTYYLQIFNTHGGFAGEDFLFCMWFWFGFFFYGLVAIKSLAVLDRWHSVIIHLLHVKQEAPNWNCSQLEVPSSTDGMSTNLFIVKALEMKAFHKHWHQQSLLPERFLEHSLANQAGVTHGWIICKNSCSTAPL